MKLILIRHFQTPGNQRGAYIGSTDEPLDESKIPCSIPVYPGAGLVAASPLKRCLETAELIYPGREKIICPLLKELDFGDYEGKTYEELKDEPAYRNWVGAGGLGAFPGGEDRMEFQKRCVEGIEELIDTAIRQNQTSVAAVVHGGTIMAVLSAFDPKKRPFYEWQVRNGEGYLTEIHEAEWIAGERIFYRIRELSDRMENKKR